MDKIKITGLDGSVEQQTEALKALFGLKPEQSFQDLDVDEDTNEKK